MRRLRHGYGVLGVLLSGCYASHGAVEATGDATCAPACVAQPPGALVPFSTTLDSGAPVHWRISAGCVQLTHDQAFLDAGGNTLDLSAAASHWARIPCAPILCDALSHYDDEWNAGVESPMFRIHVTARPTGSSREIPMGTSLWYSECTGDLWGAEVNVEPVWAGEVTLEDYLFPLGFALGLRRPDPGVDSAMNGARAPTPHDEEALCAMYASGACD